MPHDGLDDGSCATVVQTVVGTSQSSAQSAAPEWGSATPARADVVLHEQTVLNHIRIGPDGLVRIAWQHLRGILADALCVGLRRGVYPHIVGTRLPRRTMTLCTAYLVEQLLAALHLRFVQVTGGRNGQSAVPYHELIVLLVAHLVLSMIGSPLEQVLVEGFLLANRRTAQNLVHTLLDTCIGAVGIVGMQDARLLGTVRLDIGNDIIVLALCLGPCRRGVEPVAVGTCHVGDVPDGIGSSSVLQRATRHGIGEALQRTMVAMKTARIVVGCRIICRCLELTGLLIPHGGVQFDIRSFFGPLGLDVFVADSVDESCTIDTNGRLQTHLVVRGFRIGVERRDGNGDLRIDE